MKSRTMPPPRVARARPQSLQRRRELLGVVYEQIAEHGIDGVSMRQIAEAAQLSTGSVNYHFQNKRNLIIAALEAAYELPDDWGQYTGSPFAQLQRLASRYVFRSARDRFWLFWVNYTAHSSRDEEMRRHQQARYERQHLFWCSLIRDGVAAGELRAELDPEAVAEELLLVAHGLVVRQIQSPLPETRAHARETLQAHLEGLLAAHEG